MRRLCCRGGAVVKGALKARTEDGRLSARGGVGEGVHCCGLLNALVRGFLIASQVDPSRFYRTLRIVNPSPYMYFLRFGLRVRVQGSVRVQERARCIAVAAGITCGGPVDPDR